MDRRDRAGNRSGGFFDRAGKGAVMVRLWFREIVGRTMEETSNRRKTMAEVINREPCSENRLEEEAGGRRRPALVRVLDRWQETGRECCLASVVVDRR